MTFAPDLIKSKENIFCHGLSTRRATFCTNTLGNYAFFLDNNNRDISHFQLSIFFINK